MKQICAKCSGQQSENKWLPRGIDEYREVILARITEGEVDYHDWRYPVFSNIAYNLQYLEYLNKCFEELYVTSVIRAQNVKMFTLITSQIIECLLYLKLVEMGVDKNEIWDFSKAIRISLEKNPYGLGYNFYKNDLRRLKELRNKIHLQSPGNMTEADYLVFEKLEVLNTVKSDLYYFLQRVLKLDKEKMDQIFYYLLDTKEFVHSVKE